MGEGAREVTDNNPEQTPNDPEVERLVEDIEETRNEMTGTVEEIGDRLDPKNIVADAKETVRNATVGKVEEMANTAGEVASDATETIRETGSSVIDMVTRNPIPAAMIGIGVGWLVMSGRKEQHTYRSNGSWSSNRASQPGAIDQAKRKVDEMTGDLGDAVDQATGKVSRFADDVPEQIRSTAYDVGDTAGQVYSSNPLAVGAIAVAVGTAIGLALPPTDMERRTIAEPARKALSAVEDVATDALGQAEQTARDVEEQALEEDRQARPH